MTYNPDEEFAEVVGSEKLQAELNNVLKFMLSGHSWRTIGGLAIVFLIGGFQALHGIGGVGAWADMILPFFLILEHAIAGKTE